MQNQRNLLPTHSQRAAISSALVTELLPDTSPADMGLSDITAQNWFARGSRVSYDPKTRKILRRDDAAISLDVLRVYRHITRDASPEKDATWLSFLPGWPDGSFGWSKVDRHLTGSKIGPSLFVEYVGHGDSDKPDDYSYGTFERADLVEALWEAEGIKSTFIVGFDYSSIVTLELLSRQQDRREKGIEPATVIKGVLLINGGLFVEAHTHPWYTTPILKSPLGGMVTALGQRSKLLFSVLMRPLWSKGFTVTSHEIEEIHNAISRRNGVVSISKSAGFVDQHKQNAERWNLGRIYKASRDTVSFHIVGSEEDQIEGKQAIMAQKRLGEHGLDVRILPGGHLTTSEHPDLIAQIILEVAVRDHQRKPEVKAIKTLPGKKT